MVEVEYRQVAALIPYVNNSRTHDDSQVTQIAASIKEFGFTNPLLVDSDNGIIAGHGRLMAAKKLGLDEVPTILLDGLSEAQKKAYIIADNKLALNAGWDMDLLVLEIEGLKELDFDIGLLGFDADELDELFPLEVDGLTDEDEVPEVPEVPTTKLGDIYQLGNHRLMCGDSTSIDAVELLMDGVKADMVFTDPPYNIDFKPPRGTHDKILNDAMSDSDFSLFLDGVFDCCSKSLKPDTYAFVWCGWSTVGDFKNSLNKFFDVKSLHIWVKNNFGIGYYSRPKYEPFFLCLNGKPIKPAKAPADVWDFAKVHKTIHSCEKPVGLIIEILNTYNKNGSVIDLFGGSGSTLIACEKTNRYCYMMELDPKYCDVIIKRWQDYTGKKAIHAETGEEFKEVSHG